MTDVWVAGVYDARQREPAIGGWICPALRVYAVTRRARAVNSNDAMRVGAAMAILSATHHIDGHLIVHLPASLKPRWVARPGAQVPMRNLLYRLRYCLDVHPRIESGEITIVQDYNPMLASQLDALLRRGEEPRYVPATAQVFQ